MPNLQNLVIQTPPPLDPAWLQWEKDNAKPPITYASILDRQPVYAEERRQLHAKLLAPGAQFHEFSEGITATLLTVPSTIDNFAIPVIQYSSTSPVEVVVVYYHGGGLFVGEADSEELSCRRIVKQIPNSTVYSVGYRLNPTFPATTSLQDSTDAFDAILKLAPPQARIVLVGSSSGGELAAFMQQQAGPGVVTGTVLRGPVTCNAGNGPEYVPERLRASHTSASEAFSTSLGGIFVMDPPRAGLERMPLEVEPERLRGLGRTWIQVSSNDTLYSDGVCYAMLLEEAGVEVDVKVVEGFPHTFWLKAPEMERAVRTEEEMVQGIKWVLSG
ncbi:Alpha/Beta hydrolase protein [Plectosphaerella cucumerina]|uniref:Alpha/Beta hydrolase protein n=1 Tax=Plectosphaerella cucumerina TaxID=40658 RepID=A0A8K0X0Y4_9PEZI|nr:Alpha/Beta hydrolase protein [Plectosphaerella cucumerina]